MITCPVCDEVVSHQVSSSPSNTLLHHVWGHLQEKYFGPLAKGSREWRVCWCGKGFPYFISWRDHMWMLDVQAHYAASMLGIDKAPQVLDQAMADAMIADYEKRWGTGL
jgi:hypothetical protein